ncbi:Ig-like domain-containing protein, partial [Patescibacteria group bacterium]|nr:Ig-like domain-containing protein [Patescibacteria group bacterium]
RVVICHIPPGNPGNAHTIEVGAPAVPAHIAHGDTLGACEVPATPTPTPTPTPTATPTPTPTPTPQPENSVNVSNISYTLYGGKSSDKHLDDTLTIVDNNGNPVSGATVSITLTNDLGSGPWIGTATTGSEGIVTFSLKSAPGGCYETTVNSVTASGLNWDDATPANGICK